MKLKKNLETYGSSNLYIGEIYNHTIVIKVVQYHNRKITYEQIDSAKQHNMRKKYFYGNFKEVKCGVKYTDKRGNICTLNSVGNGLAYYEHNDSIQFACSIGIFLRYWKKSK